MWPPAHFHITTTMRCKFNWGQFFCCCYYCTSPFPEFACIFKSFDMNGKSSIHFAKIPWIWKTFCTSDLIENLYPGQTLYKIPFRSNSFARPAFCMRKTFDALLFSESFFKYTLESCIIIAKHSGNNGMTTMQTDERKNQTVWIQSCSMSRIMDVNARRCGFRFIFCMHISN